MALARFQNLPLARREEILRVAAEAFAEQGFDKTSYNELLNRLKMGKSQAYYYFADKADLFATVLGAVYEEYYEEVARLPEPQSVCGFWEYVRELHLVGFRFQHTHPIAARLSAAAGQLGSSLRFNDAALQGEGTTEQRYQAWIARGQALGAVRVDLPVDFLVALCIRNSALIDAWFAERAATVTCREMAALADQFTDLSRRILEPAA